MVIVTGAGGFIGFNLINYLNQLNITDIIAVDDWSRPEKMKLLENKTILAFVHRDKLKAFLNKFGEQEVYAVFHLGARTDTTEFRKEIFDKLNVEYSKDVWKSCIQHNIPLIYASSAATYGDGTLGFDDDESQISKLKPLNPYGESKQEFDLWVLSQKEKPPFWVGLKFFNVYGYGEQNKGRMASVIFHSIQQWRNTGVIKLFKSHNPNYVDGGQMRDFIHVHDVVRVMTEFFNAYLLSKKKPRSGIYNLGTGKARTFNDLASAIFTTINVTPKIDYIDTPVDIRDKYQYFTQANVEKLKSAGISTEFIDLEQGVKDYIYKLM